MPKITLTGYERRITEFTAQRQIPMSRSKTQRLALKLHRRQARMQDIDLERIITYSDPTGETATSNVMTKNNGPGTVTKQFSEAVQPAP